MSQETRRAPGYKDYQVRARLGKGVRVWCDPDMVPLLRALNKAGLKTRSHCGGHGSGHRWVAIRAKNIEELEVRRRKGYDEILIQWRE